MKELVIISGKGGTGKTSITASFAAMATSCVLADCDVDAADLHLIMAPEIVQSHEFSGGSVARVKPGHCTACGKCEEICRFDAVFFDGPGNGRLEKTFRVDPIKCEGCGVCAFFCKDNAIDFQPQVNGRWFFSRTRHGPMVHARMNVGAENSGKLVSIIRREAREYAESKGYQLLLVDGPPGIGCPVIASVTGADMVVIVTEPTLSGIHDLNRIAHLVRHFQIPARIIINKWDINPELAGNIETSAADLGMPVVGRVTYDAAFLDAQLAAQSIVEYSGGVVSGELKLIWNSIVQSLTNDGLS